MLQSTLSAVSMSIFASTYSYCIILQALLDLRTSAPLQTQRFRACNANFIIVTPKCWQLSVNICRGNVVKSSAEFGPARVTCYIISKWCQLSSCAALRFHVAIKTSFSMSFGRMRLKETPFRSFLNGVSLNSTIDQSMRRSVRQH